MNLTSGRLRQTFDRFRGTSSHGSEPPVVASDVRWSAVSSAVDFHPAPTDELLELLLESARLAHKIDLETVAARGSAEQAAWLQLWPGEHYRLLAGLVEALQPRTVVEIGTFQGLGALALSERLPAGSVLVSFDVIPWQEIPGSLLTEEDFAKGRLEQRLGDLSDPAVFARHGGLLRQADLVFMDAPKDGQFEPAFLDLAVPLWRDASLVLVLDDVRLLPMLQLWRDLPYPKLDATSFGHWSGTGLAMTGERSRSAS